MNTNRHYKILTSNETKIAEYKCLNLNIDIEKGDDLPEISSSDYHLIAAHKAKDAGIFNIVEDTIIIIEDYVCYDLKFKIQDILDNLDKYKGMKAKSVVTISYMNEYNIFTFEGIVEGVIDNLYQKNEDSTVGFHFDSFLYVNHKGRSTSIQELKDKKEEEQYSARRKAAILMKRQLSGIHSATKTYSKNIQKWKGDYQS
jgi:hypothetical protein